MKIASSGPPIGSEGLKTARTRPKMLTHSGHIRLQRRAQLVIRTMVGLWYLMEPTISAVLQAGADASPRVGSIEPMRRPVLNGGTSPPPPKSTT